jgi:uncharacterized metal-binding protein
MKNKSEFVDIRFKNTNQRCPVGEKTGKANLERKKIPVLSCEGGCIRGEIARVAANILSKKEGFGRACHGEIITVPDSAIANWVKHSKKVVLIDGCYLHCHGRILEELLSKDQLMVIDALRVYKKYTDLFDLDAIPEEDIKIAAEQVVDVTLEQI